MKVPTKEGELIKQGPEVKVNKPVKGIDELFKGEIMAPFVKNSGQFVLLPKGTKILNNIYDLLEQYIRKELNFEEVMLPKMVPVDTLRKADVLYKWDSYLEVVRPWNKTKGVKEDYLLDPLQCTSFYQIHENKTVDIEKGPMKWYDRSGPSYRNEDIDKIEPCIKLREFHRAEFIYLGTKQQVIEAREKCLTQLEKLCSNLNLKYRIVVGGGCYQLKKCEIEYPETKDEIPIKDLEIYIPHQDRWLEVIGSSVQADTLTSRFNIKGKNGNFLWSGCTGIGLERFMYTIISTHGLK